jgi:thiamine kinase-like enzyme
LAGDSAKTKKALDVLVDLQCRLQKSGSAGDWAPDIKLRFRDDLARNDRLSPDLREKLLGILERLPDGRALCHCDFHAGNVFFDGTNYTIIDLLQICKGDPAADAVCSYVSYSFVHRELGEYYLNRYCNASGISRENVLRWLSPYAGTLLGQVPEQYTPIIEEFIDAEKTME